MEIKTMKTTPAIIDFNFEEIKNNLIEYSKKYVGLIVTEENEKEMVVVKNELSKLEKTIDSYRLERKKELEKPIKEFEIKCKELMKVIEEVSYPIREQLNFFEEKRKEAKEKEVNILIQKIIEKYNLEKKYSDQLTINSKYLNKGQKEKDTAQDLEQRAEALKNMQEQEKQLQKMKEEKIDLIQKTIDKKNKEHLLNLKISNFMNLIEKTATEIIEEIDKVVNSELQKIEKINNEKQEEIKEGIKITEKELKKTYLITIRNIDKTDMEKIKNELNSEFYDFEIKEI